MISVIIPTYNEEAHIEQTIRTVLENGNNKIKEILVVDGGSSDATIQRAANAGANIINSSIKGRAAQMNVGATHATTNVLYFLHADSVLPTGFANSIEEAIDVGYIAGCFRLRFDHSHWFLILQCWFTRFDVNAFRYGDQSLFVTKEIFERCGGFNENLILMEDNEIIGRLKKFGKFKVINRSIVTSARKYIQNGIFKTQFTFYMLYFLYKFNYPQQKLLSIFRVLIKQDKV